MQTNHFLFAQAVDRVDEFLRILQTVHLNLRASRRRSTDGNTPCPDESLHDVLMEVNASHALDPDLHLGRIQPTCLNKNSFCCHCILRTPNTNNRMDD